jgi:CheY-like chemotaxis protein
MNIKDLTGVRILVAEDEEINFLYFKEILTRAHVTIYHALNGAEAVDLFHKHEDIDLILMDIKMPIMDGLEAAHIIKNEKKSTSIIALTAYALEGDREKFLKAGFDDYLSKPVTVKALMDKIELFVSNKFNLS